VVGVELVQIDFDLEFLGGPAPGDDLDDAVDGQEAALQDPVLNRAQIGQSEVWGPHYLIAENLADQARALDRGLHIVRKIDPLLQAQSGLRVSEIVINPVLEHDWNEGRSREGGGGEGAAAGGGGEPALHGEGEITPHLRGGGAGRWGGDLEDDGRGFGIAFNINFAKGNDPTADENQKTQ